MKSHRQFISLMLLFHKGEFTRIYLSSVNDTDVIFTPTLFYGDYSVYGAGIAQAQSPQLVYDLIDGVDLRLVIGR